MNGGWLKRFRRVSMVSFGALALVSCGDIPFYQMDMGHLDLDHEVLLRRTAEHPGLEFYRIRITRSE